MNNYENFANKEIQNLIYIQNKFKENFNLDYYENWFYEERGIKPMEDFLFGKFTKKYDENRFDEFYSHGLNWQSLRC